MVTGSSPTPASRVPPRSAPRSWPSAGQGGFGAVFGAKNLKAISVIGTGHVHVNDPKELLATRLWHKENYAFDLDDLKETWSTFQFQSPPVPIILWAKGRPTEDQRPLACLGLLTGSCCPHYDGEAERRPAYHRLISRDEILPGFESEGLCRVEAHIRDYYWPLSGGIHDNAWVGERRHET